jgi:Flp pilus assembly protein TadG
MFKNESMTARRSKSRERGAATLVELAFTLPILIVFILGIMDFSRAMYAYHFASSAAREASRYASVRGTSCNTWPSACPAAASDIASYVQTLEPSGLNFTNPPSTTACTGSSAAGCISVVTTWPGTGGGGWTPATCSIGNGHTNNPGCLVIVTVTYRFGFLLQSRFSIATLTLPSTSEIVVLQ